MLTISYFLVCGCGFEPGEFAHFLQGYSTETVAIIWLKDKIDKWK